MQRRHAFAGRHVPHLERLVVRRRHDALPVRKHCNAKDLRRRHINTKNTTKSGRRATHGPRVPLQRHAFAGRHVPHLEHVAFRPRHEAPPVRKHGNAKDLRRRHINTKSTTNCGRRATHARVRSQRRHAFTGCDVPHLKRAVPRPRHDAPPVRKHRSAADLQRRHITQKYYKVWTPRAARLSCALSASALRRAWTGPRTPAQRPRA